MKKHSRDAFIHLALASNMTFNMVLFQPASSEEQKKMQKAMSSVDLGKSDSLRKNSQDGRFALCPGLRIN